MWEYGPPPWRSRLNICRGGWRRAQGAARAPPWRHRAPPCSKTVRRPSPQQSIEAKGEGGDKQVSYFVYFIRQRHQLTLRLFTSFPRRPWCRQRRTTRGDHGPGRRAEGALCLLLAGGGGAPATISTTVAVAVDTTINQDKRGEGGREQVSSSVCFLCQRHQLTLRPFTSFP